MSTKISQERFSRLKITTIKVAVREKMMKELIYRCPYRVINSIVYISVITN